MYDLHQIHGQDFSKDIRIRKSVKIKGQNNDCKTCGEYKDLRDPGVLGYVSCVGKENLSGVREVLSVTPHPIQG